MKIRYAAPLAFLVLAGCFSYSSTRTRTAPPAPLATPAPVCVYAGQPYSPGARVVSPSGAIECHPDGSWSRS